MKIKPIYQIDEEVAEEVIEALKDNPSKNVQYFMNVMQDKLNATRAEQTNQNNEMNTFFTTTLKDIQDAIEKGYLSTTVRYSAKTIYEIIMQIDKTYPYTKGKLTYHLSHIDSLSPLWGKIRRVAGNADAGPILYSVEMG